MVEGEIFIADMRGGSVRGIWKTEHGQQNRLDYGGGRRRREERGTRWGQEREKNQEWNQESG